MPRLPCSRPIYGWTGHRRPLKRWQPCPSSRAVDGARRVRCLHRYSLRGRADSSAELTGYAGGSTHQDATRTGEALANARIHFSRSGAALSLAPGGGTTWDGSGWRRVLLGEIGAWADFGAGTAVLKVSPVSVDDSAKYVDGQLAVNWTSGRLDLSTLAATRWGSRAPFDPTGTRTWASVNVTAWATPVFGIVGATGTYPVDPTQGFPADASYPWGSALRPVAAMR